MCIYYYCISSGMPDEDLGNIPFKMLPRYKEKSGFIIKIPAWGDDDLTLFEYIFSKLNEPLDGIRQSQTIVGGVILGIKG